MKQLNSSFFKQDTIDVAKNLLGKVIKVWNKYWLIYETEAYKHKCDEASHAYWKKTERNKLMYDTYGYVYVYLIYWVHYCLNFTSDTIPGAVLIRWIVPFENLKKIDFSKKIDWPGKLTKYFWIDKSFNWENLENSNKIWVYDINYTPGNIIATPRIWISKAKDKLRRFIIDKF